MITYNNSFADLSEYALILVNGEVPQKDIIISLASTTKLFCCTDGAANSLHGYGINPDIIIGDLDSIADSTKKFFEKNCKIISRPSQYATDLEKSLDYVLERQIKHVLLLGLKGRRFDHAIFNLHIIHKYKNKIKFLLADDSGYGCFFFSEERLQFRDKVDLGTQVSLIPFLEANSVKTYGLKYPLNNEDLVWGVRGGQSNEATDKNIIIEIKSGGILIWIESSII